MYQQPQYEAVSPKSWVVTLLLSLLTGGLGGHRFYVGKIGTGILMLLTCGGLGVWAIIDLIVVIMGNFKDSDGLPVKNQA
ncbi:TM2 domain-containing protein [Nocardiopsis sp. CT-R113]|uniref:TM2 domain-containing protein n=1 Tax=Nocardiopsis codii TaxID=3065942 RepID=A0ABU7KGA7_9ACTN|nr:TM2 domain-containing protein [Nocardiopsis sp. CT-R113]MEE2041062.1 TM2 domain-containing protein [Nocardiopsis sp. CT-R113]